MASTAMLLLQLLLVSLASASHYSGIIVTVNYKGNSSVGNHELDFYSRVTHRKSCAVLSWSGVFSQSQAYSRVVDASIVPTNQPLLCQNERKLRIKASSNKPFSISERDCCWGNTANSLKSIRILNELDLAKRSDTEKPNRSPKIGILPFLRVPQNCPHTYKIMSFDADGDKVRCRYGKTSTECSRCSLSSGFLLDEDSCTLRHNHTSANTYSYGLEMMVEDFPRGSINLEYADGSKSSKSPYTNGLSAPLSKLSLQFLLLVSPPAPSCEVGLYLPKLLPPTPAYGDRIRAQVNEEVQIRVKAQAKSATLVNIAMNGPLKMTKQKQNDEYVLKWTPLPDDVGRHFPVCFAVEAKTGSRIYQSDMRCVLVEVTPEQESHVICSQSSMTVFVNRSSLSQLHEDHMQLNDNSDTACSLHRLSNSTHIIAVVPLNACGTQLEEDDENLIFKNEITTVDNGSYVITRKHNLEVQFSCQYPKRGNVSQSFTIHRENVTVMEKGFGNFTYQFEFYPNSQFQTMINPNLYPLEFDLGDRIYMKIEASSTVDNTELFVESCRAAPYDNINYRQNYTIIENGCKVDPTVEFHGPDHHKQFKFSLEAFKFIGQHDQIYISCSLMMCAAGNNNTRCSKGCIGNSNPAVRRRKREAVIQTANHFVSQGPLRLRREAEKAGAMANNLNLNLVFIAGCVLAAVGMVCGVLLYRTRVSTVKYTPLPTFEN